jgi:hypothetical protein
MSFTIQTPNNSSDYLGFQNFSGNNLARIVTTDTGGGQIQVQTGPSNNTAITIDNNQRFIVSGNTNGGGYDSTIPGIYFQKNYSSAESNVPFIRSEGDSTTTHLAMGPTSTSGSFRIYTGNSVTKRLTVDSNGYVTMPNQPAFIAKVTNAHTFSPGVTTNVSTWFDATDINRGNCYNTSSGKFTAPVTGVYLFNYKYYIYPVSSIESFFYVNGASWVRFQMIYNYSTNTNPGGSMGAALINLTAGDYVEQYVNFNTAGSSTCDMWNGGPRSSMWSGYLIG